MCLQAVLTEGCVFQSVCVCVFVYTVHSTFWKGEAAYLTWNMFDGTHKITIQGPGSKLKLPETNIDDFQAPFETSHEWFYNSLNFER